jgi:hypothetical protein
MHPSGSRTHTVTALLAAMCLILMPTAAGADGSSRPHGGGGRFAVYFPIIAKYNKSGERFRIEGFCRSACTLFLGIRNVCVDRKAFVSFHAGPDRVTKKWGPNSSSTKTMLRAYKPALRRYLVDGHHVDRRTYHTLSGATLIDRFGYHECPPGTPPLPIRAERG